ncbi:MAG: methyltransferase [Bacteriovoracaceae bacterium]|nr:methyltransferase [Bacteriovoracaceae bacterium]
MKYSQPNFYTFSEDSILLASAASALSYHDGVKVLDLMSGCGIVGLELIKRLNCSGEIHFLEMQEAFISHLEENTKKMLGKSWKSKIYNIDFKETLENENYHRYDLIVCNPPYYISEESRVSPNQSKSLCRSIALEDAFDLFNFIESKLDDEGRCLILLTDNLLKHLGEKKNNFKVEILKKLSRSSIVLLTGLHGDRSQKI